MTNAIQSVQPDDTAATPDTDAFLRARNIVEAINQNIPKGLPQLPPIPKDYIFRKRDRETVSIAFHAAFELVGGVPNLIQWASHNPDKFYPLYSKLLQSDTLTPTGNTFIFSSAVPASPLDRVTVNVDGHAVDLDDEDLPE